MEPQVHKLEPESGLQRYGRVALDQVEKRGLEASKTASVARKFVKFFYRTRHVSKHFKELFGVTSLLSGIPGIFAIPDFVGKIRDIFTAQKPSDKGVAGLKAAELGAGITASVCDVARGLAAAGSVAQEAIEWTGTAGFVAMPFTAIGLGFAAHNVYKIHRLEGELPAKEQPTIGKEAAELEQNLLYIQKERHSIEKMLELDKGSLEKVEKIAGKVDKVAKGVFEKAEEPPPVEEAKTFMNALKERVSKIKKMKYFDLVIKIFSITCLVLLLFSPASPVLLGLAATAAFAGLSMFFYRRFVMERQLALQKV